MPSDFKYRRFKLNQTGNALIKGSLCEELLDVKFDNKSTLDRHFKSSYKKANTQLKVVARFVLCMRFAKKAQKE